MKRQEKIDKILKETAKKMVDELGEEELDYQFFGVEDILLGSKIKIEIINALPPNGDLIKKIALWAGDHTYSITAIRRITDEDTLESVIYSNSHSGCRIIAIKRINNPEKLLRIIRDKNIPYVVKAKGIENINRREDLEKLLNDKSLDSMLMYLINEKLYGEKDK